MHGVRPCYLATQRALPHSSLLFIGLAFITACIRPTKVQVTGTISPQPNIPASRPASGEHNKSLPWPTFLQTSIIFKVQVCPQPTFLQTSISHFSKFKCRTSNQSPSLTCCIQAKLSAHAAQTLGKLLALQSPHARVIDMHVRYLADKSAGGYR